MDNKALSGIMILVWMVIVILFGTILGSLSAGIYIGTFLLIAGVGANIATNFRGVIGTTFIIVGIEVLVEWTYLKSIGFQFLG